MHQNEEKIGLNELIAWMALNRLYDRYLNEGDKDVLCEDINSLIEFCNDNNILKENDRLVKTINRVILSEDLIKWQKERPTNE